MSNGRHDIPSLPEITRQTVSWIQEAGKIALGYFRNVAVSVKKDSSLLTNADIEIEQFLVDKIQATYPDHAVIGEEGIGDKNGHQSAYNWAIDPLDGTTSFVHGLPGWGISLGLLHDGEPLLGVFYMPLVNDIIYTNGQGIFCNDQHLQQSVRPDWGRKGFLAVSAGAHYDFELDILRIRALGSVGASLVYTARGAAAAALIPKAYVWDLVAGGYVLQKAGGELRYLSGKMVNYRDLLDGQLAPEPIIASHANMFAELQKTIQPRKALIDTLSPVP